jgi:hypothetical protein
MAADTKITLVAKRWLEPNFIQHRVVSPWFSVPGSRSLVLLDLSCKMRGDCAIKLPTGYAGFEGTLIRNVVLGLVFEQVNSAVSGNHAVPKSDWYVF